jgi:hypothetical protein
MLFFFLPSGVRTDALFEATGIIWEAAAGAIDARLVREVFHDSPSTWSAASPLAE